MAIKIKNTEEIVELPLKDINEPEIAIRSKMSREKLDSLENSIQQIGIIQPIVVMKKGKRYEIIVGHRRYVAAHELGLESIPARIFSAERAKNAEVAKMHENSEREGVNPMDEARFIERIHNKYNLSQAQIAEKFGRSEGYISQRLKLMNAPEEVKEALANDEISFSVARELAQIDDPVELRQLLHYAVTNGITPSVARSWRLSYEARKEVGQNAGANPSEPIPISPEDGSASFVCEICGNPTKMNQMKIIRVCPHCANEVQKATRNP